MSPQRKTGVLTLEEQQQYDDITAKKSLQQLQYSSFLERLGQQGKDAIRTRCSNLGFDIDFETGQIQYSRNFQPLTVGYDLWYVRHGKTEGNTEPRVYQVYFC